MESYCVCSLASGFCAQHSGCEISPCCYVWQWFVHFHCQVLAHVFEYHVFEYISIMSFGEYIRVCFFIGIYLGVGLIYYADKVLFFKN